MSALGCCGEAPARADEPKKAPAIDGFASGACAEETGGAAAPSPRCLSASRPAADGLEAGGLAPAGRGAESSLLGACAVGASAWPGATFGKDCELMEPAGRGAAAGAGAGVALLGAVAALLGGGACRFRCNAAEPVGAIRGAGAGLKGFAVGRAPAGTGDTPCSVADFAAGLGGGASAGAGKELSAIGGWLTPPAEAPTTDSLISIMWPHWRHFILTDRPMTFSSAIWYLALQLGQRNFMPTQPRCQELQSLCILANPSDIHNRFSKCSLML